MKIELQFETVEQMIQLCSDKLFQQELFVFGGKGLKVSEDILINIHGPLKGKLLYEFNTNAIRLYDYIYFAFREYPDLKSIDLPTIYNYIIEKINNLNILEYKITMEYIMTNTQIPLNKEYNIEDSAECINVEGKIRFNQRGCISAAEFLKDKPINESGWYTDSDSDWDSDLDPDSFRIDNNTAIVKSDKVSKR